MTPKELFDLISDDSCTRYEILHAVEQINPSFIPVYLQDLEELRIKFADEQFQKANERMWDSYYSECDFLFSIELEWGKYTGEYPKKPTPLDIPDYPTKPKLYDFLIKHLSNLSEPTDIQTPDTSADRIKPTDSLEGLRLPDGLNTERARKYFARAVEAKFMELTPTGAKWLKPLARLGYLCLKIYPQPRPIAALEKYFNVRKLSSNITNASIDAYRADVIKWRAEIDKIFID